MPPPRKCGKAPGPTTIRLGETYAIRDPPVADDFGLTVWTCCLSRW